MLWTYRATPTLVLRPPALRLPGAEVSPWAARELRRLHPSPGLALLDHTLPLPHTPPHAHKAGLGSVETVQKTEPRPLVQEAGQGPVKQSPLAELLVQHVQALAVAASEEPVPQDIWK